MNKKLTAEDKKSICMLLDMGEFTQKEVAEKYKVTYSTINKMYREHLQGDIKPADDSFEDKNILDTDEVRLVNKTLMQENEELRNRLEKINGLGDKNIPDNVKRFNGKCKTMQEIYASKNIKYGNSFTKTYQEYGKAVLCIRLEDKLARAKQLLLKNIEASADESIIDTLTDLANYAVMAVMELENEQI